MKLHLARAFLLILLAVLQEKGRGACFNTLEAGDLSRRCAGSEQQSGSALDDEVDKESSPRSGRFLASLAKLAAINSFLLGSMLGGGGGLTGSHVFNSPTGQFSSGYSFNFGNGGLFPPWPPFQVPAPQLPAYPVGGAPLPGQLPLIPLQPIPYPSRRTAPKLKPTSKFNQVLAVKESQKSGVKKLPPSTSGLELPSPNFRPGIIPNVLNTPRHQRL